MIIEILIQNISLFVLAAVAQTDQLNIFSNDHVHDLLRFNKTK